MADRVSMIVAKDSKNAIGKDNGIPWYIPNDFKHFKKKTEGKTVIMGRLTYESIGKPLPNRLNVVLSGDVDYEVPEGVITVHSFKGVEKVIKETPGEVFIIGGSFLFKQFLGITDRLYITEVKGDFNGDTHFPKIDRREWELNHMTTGAKDENNPYDYAFYQYDRKRGESLL